MVGRPKINPKTEAAISGALQVGGTGIRQIAAEFTVGTSAV
jgi:hypothetical protein